MHKKQDKPDEPAYSGGEDETTEGDKNKSDTRHPSHRSTDFPVDESDDGPSTAPDDTGEGS